MSYFIKAGLIVVSTWRIILLMLIQLKTWLIFTRANHIACYNKAGLIVVSTWGIILMMLIQLKTWLVNN